MCLRNNHWSVYLMKFLAVLFVCCLIALSVSLLAKTCTDPETYYETIQSIDEKKMTVLSVSAAIAGSATLLASVPDDATTPLAEELMDLSSYLVIVVCVLVLEKSLLTVFGAVSCYILFPFSGILAMGYIFKRKSGFLTWSAKILVLGLAFLFLIPGSMKLSNYIYEVNQVSIEQEVETVVESTQVQEENNSEEEELPWYKKLWGAVTEAVESTANAAVESGKQALNKFVDAVSVFVIAYCAIPICIIFLFLWLFKFLFGININVNAEQLNPKRLKGAKKRLIEEQYEEI